MDKFDFDSFQLMKQIDESDLPGGTKMLLKECYRALQEAKSKWREETRDDIYSAMDFFYKCQQMPVTFAQDLDCREMADLHPLLPEIKRQTYVYINALQDFRSKRTTAGGKNNSGNIS